MTETTLPISPEVFWGVVYTGLFVIACLAVGALLSPPKNHHIAPLTRLQSNLGLRKVNSGLFLIALLMWGIVAFLLVAGLIGTVWDLIWQSFPANNSEFWGWRFALVKLTALTATLGAVVAFPITMQRLRLTQLQTETASEALFSEKINAAANDLHAQRQVTIHPEDAQRRADIWQDDIVKRNAAIDQLEILVQERPDTAPRVARMLSTYVRELSKEFEPVPVPDGMSLTKLNEWADSLVARRSDMENAVQTLGRLQTIAGVDPSTVSIDLRYTNLQGFALDGANFANSLFTDADMQGTELRAANLQRAKFFGAQMQAISLHLANLRQADISFSTLEGADLSGANMMGADLYWTKMDSLTNLNQTNLQYAGLSHVDYTDVQFTQDQVDSIFYDGSAIFHSSIERSPNHETEMEWIEFQKPWRAWQKSIRFDPDTYQA